MLTGSYNMIVSTLTDRDVNLMRIEWTDGNDKAFEQQVCRPHFDQFMRAWNSDKMSQTMGKPSRPASPRPQAAKGVEK